MSSKERQCRLEFRVFILRLPSSSARSCGGWIRFTRRVDDLVEERFAEELDFGQSDAPRKRGRPRKNPR